MTDATHTLDAGKAEAAAGTAALAGGTATGEVALGLAHFKEANERVRAAEIALTSRSPCGPMSERYTAA